jgi:ribosomal protein S18 acetylase RimI-like enzyme
MKPILIRRATAADLDGIALLFDAYRQFYEQPADLALARRFIDERMQRGESVILVAENETGTGELIGFCQLYPAFCSVLARPTQTLYDLYVSPAARRSGAGRALMLAAETDAAAHGFARLDLTTARDNQRAQALYESLDWKLDEVFLAYNKALTA